MARRPNYGFEKKQRELRKQKKNEEKAERRSREEGTGPVPTIGEAGYENPPELGAPDHG
ncbi:MAG: hypothetical protein O2992_11440 [Gemmatimonadetes bacterium]|nr:hypothetical protein [Gemmatimonadota bacterium]